MSPEQKNAEINKIVVPTNGIGRDGVLLLGADDDDTLLLPSQHIDDDSEQDPYYFLRLQRGLVKLALDITNALTPTEPEFSSKDTSFLKDIRLFLSTCTYRLSEWLAEDISLTAKIKQSLDDQYEPQPSLNNRRALFEEITVLPTEGVAKTPKVEKKQPLSLFPKFAALAGIAAIAITQNEPIKDVIKVIANSRVPDFNLNTHLSLSDLLPGESTTGIEVVTCVDNPNDPEIVCLEEQGNIYFEYKYDTATNTVTEASSTDETAHTLIRIPEDAENAVFTTPFLGSIYPADGGNALVYTGVQVERERTLEDGTIVVYVSDQEEGRASSDPIVRVTFGVAPVPTGTVGSIIKQK